MHDPQDKPTPNPERTIKSLLLIFFSLLACFKLKGIVEDTVFPKNLRLLYTFLLGKFNEFFRLFKITLLP